MAYTIKGLAKANECEEHNAYELAAVWSYWLDCNSCDMQSVNDFKRLRKADRAEMMGVLTEYYPRLAKHILNHVNFC